MENKRQHVIPLCYQRFFSENFLKREPLDRRKGSLYCLNIQDNKQFKTSLESNLVKKDRYTILENSNRDLSIEKLFSDIESIYPLFVNSIYSQERISEDIISRFFCFLEYLCIRTDSFRNKLVDFITLHQMVYEKDSERYKKKISRLIENQATFNVSHFNFYYAVPYTIDLLNPYSLNEKLFATQIQLNLIKSLNTNNLFLENFLIRNLRSSIVIIKNNTMIPFISSDSPFIWGDTNSKFKYPSLPLSHNLYCVIVPELMLESILEEGLEIEIKSVDKFYFLETNSKNYIESVNENTKNNAFEKIFSPIPF